MQPRNTTSPLKHCPTSLSTAKILSLVSFICCQNGINNCITNISAVVSINLQTENSSCNNGSSAMYGNVDKI